jgi:hypothetical protein
VPADRAAEAQALVAGGAPAAGGAPTSRPASGRDPRHEPIGGKARWQGRTVYLVARTERRDRYSRPAVVGLVTSRDGRHLAVVAGGSRTAWIASAELTVERTYETAWTFAGLDRRRAREEAGEGCPTCGRLSCEGAHGGLCEED